MFEIIETYFHSLTWKGLGKGYHLEPSKSVLIMHMDNFEAGKVFSERHGLIMCTGAHYIRGSIGDDESRNCWLRERMLTWLKNIGTISKTAGKYPQEIYAGVSRAILSDWIFLECVT